MHTYIMCLQLMCYGQCVVAIPHQSPPPRLRRRRLRDSLHACCRVLRAAVGRESNLD